MYSMLLIFLTVAFGSGCSRGVKKLLVSLLLLDCCGHLLLPPLLRIVFRHRPRACNFPSTTASFPRRFLPSHSLAA